MASSLRINQFLNGIQLEFLLPNNDGVRQTLMLFQLLNKPSPTKPLKQVNLHHGINHLPRLLFKQMKK